MNNYLILTCVIWISCGIATIGTHDIDPIGIAFLITILIALIWWER